MLVVDKVAGAAEIRKFQVHVLVDKDVFSLDVTVCDSRTMHELDGVNELAKQRACESFGKNLGLFKNSVQLAIISNFHNIIHHVACGAIREAGQAANLEIDDFDNVTMS